MTLSALGIFSAAGAGGVGATYELIQTQILGSNQASVTFSSLGTYASTYKHLQIRMTARTDRASTSDNLTLAFNGVGGTSYSTHELIGNGSSVSSSNFTSRENIVLPPASSASSTGSSFGAMVIDILDAFSSTKNTTVRAFGGMTSANFIVLSSGLFINTDAVSSLTIDQINGPNFVTGSRFSLYGIR
jgi:hypothetical protein